MLGIIFKYIHVHIHIDVIKICKVHENVPNVRVGATTVMNMRSETATVFWLKFIISDLQWVPMVRLKSATIPRPNVFGFPSSP